MQLTTEEKLDTIKDAAAVALDLIGQAKEALEAAEHETGYSFDYTITQELEENSIGGVAAELERGMVVAAIKNTMQDAVITKRLES